jgi:hypothetical protein
MLTKNERVDVAETQIETQERDSSPPFSITNLPAYLFDSIHRCLRLIESLLSFMPDNKLTELLKNIVYTALGLSMAALALAILIFTITMAVFAGKLLGFVFYFDLSSVMAAWSCLA